MEEISFNRNKFLISYGVAMSVIAIISMAFMLWFASSKVIIVTAEDADVQAEEEASKIRVEEKNYKLGFVTTTNDGWFVVPFPSYLTKEDIKISDRPDKKNIVIEFNADNGDFFLSNAPVGDFSKVKALYESIGDGYVRLSVETKTAVISECKISNQGLKIKLNHAGSNKKTVLVDPMYGGVYTGTCVGELMEKDINQAVATRILELCDGKDYRVVLTRKCDNTLTTAERLDILNIVGADYYVGICVHTDADNPTFFGMKAIYNDEFYRNGLENVEFAEELLKNACILTSNRGNGLEKAGDQNVILKALEIPAAVLSVGTITNQEEAILLQDDDYINKIAEGIMEALDGMVK